MAKHIDQQNDQTVYGRPDRNFKKVDSVTIDEIDKVLSKRAKSTITQITIIKNEFIKEGNPVMMMHPNDYEEYEKTLRNGGN